MFVTVTSLLNNVRFVIVMHRDVLELFIIVNSVPVLHLNQTKEDNSDTVLKAGRISAQDMLGEETTGELIQKEVLSDSVIYYGREEDILLALRVSRSMSDQGTHSLLQKVISLVRLYKPALYNSFGDREILQPLINRLNYILGSTLPTNPFSMAKINQMMGEFLETFPYFDRIGLVTQEGWVVNIFEQETYVPTKVSKYVWRNSVEILHLSLGNRNNGTIVNDDESIWWLKPIYFNDYTAPNGQSWWALIVQVNLARLYMDARKPIPKEIAAGKTFSVSSKLLQKLQMEINSIFFQNMAPIIQKMVERETRNQGRSGPLGKIIAFAEYFAENPLNFKILNETAIIENDDSSPKSFVSTNVLEKIVFFDLKDFWSNPTDTIFLTLDLPNLKFFISQLLKRPYSKIYFGPGSIDPLALKNRFESNIEIYVENTFELPPIATGKIQSISFETEISQYVFLFLENDNSNNLVAIFRKENDSIFSGFYSANNDLTSLSFNQIQQLKLV